jgi:hypothetical protein
MDDEEIQRRVRRFAVLRAAQRALREVTPPDAFAQAESEGRRLLDRLRAITGSDPASAEVVDPRQALAAVDGRLETLAEGIRSRLEEVPVRTLCSALDRMVGPEAGALRALAAIAIEGDVGNPGHLARIELLVTLLCVEGPPDARRVVRTPTQALPELARIDQPESYESHPDIDEAEQILGRAIMRLDRDDAGAARDRILRYKQRLGVRLLHPTVLRASVAYNTEMSNRLGQLLDHEHALDAFADTLLGLQTDGTRAALVRAASLARAAEEPPLRSRLLWQTLATAALAIGLLFFAIWLWPRSSIQVLPANSASEISPYLDAGYVSDEDGQQRFVGTVGPPWRALGIEDRRRIVARMAAVLAGRGIGSLTLVDDARAMQARYEDDSLLWLSSPPIGVP